MGGRQPRGPPALAPRRLRRWVGPESNRPRERRTGPHPGAPRESPAGAPMAPGASRRARRPASAIAPAPASPGDTILALWRGARRVGRPRHAAPPRRRGAPARRADAGAGSSASQPAGVSDGTRPSTPGARWRPRVLGPNRRGDRRRGWRRTGVRRAGATEEGLGVSGGSRLALALPAEGGGVPPIRPLSRRLPPAGSGCARLSTGRAPAWAVRRGGARGADRSGRTSPERGSLVLLVSRPPGRGVRGHGETDGAGSHARDAPRSITQGEAPAGLRAALIRPAMTVLLVALALDLTLGEPPNRWHPVAWIGRLRGHRARLAPPGPPWLLLLPGTLLVLMLSGAAAGAWLVTVIAPGASPHARRRVALGAPSR